MSTLLVGLSDKKRKVYLKTSISQLSWIGEKDKESKWHEIGHIGYEAVKKMIDTNYLPDLLGRYDKNKVTFTFEIEFLE